jgi:hypothetical protein
MSVSLVIHRTAIAVKELEPNRFVYNFAIKLENGKIRHCKGYAKTKEAALNEGLYRSQHMIDNGYEEGM